MQPRINKRIRDNWRFASMCLLNMTLLLIVSIMIYQIIERTEPTNDATTSKPNTYINN